MSLNPIASRVPTLLAGRLLGGSTHKRSVKCWTCSWGSASGTRLQREVMIREPTSHPVAAEFHGASGPASQCDLLG